MRTLVYAMQSSGASAYTFCQGQKEGTLCIADLYHDCLAPALEDVEGDIILKAVATTKYSLKDHMDTFRPNEVVFFERNEIDNRASLSKYSYADKDGTVHEKLEVFHKVLMDHTFPIVHYEKWMWEARMTMTMAQMLERNFSISSWAKDNYEIKWGFGGLRL